MHKLALNLILLFTSLSIASVPDYSPFFSPYTGQWVQQAEDSSDTLNRRQASCPSGYSSCSNLGGNGGCCQPNAMCALDQAGRVACCPDQSVCTGTIDGGTSSATGPPGSIVTNSRSLQTITASLTAANGAQVTVGTANPTSVGFIAPNAAPTRCPALYGVGAGIAVGLVRQAMG